MEIDFKVIKALSSPTRVKILDQTLENETTPTNLSDELGKTKSTISSHLSKLEDAELLEKDEKEGRKRVVYRPTRKAENIVKGRRKKVTFSIGTSAVSMFAGLLFGYQALDGMSSSYQAKDQAAQLSMEAADAGASAADAASTTDPGSLVSFSAEVFLVLGLFFISIAALSFVYGFTLNRLGS